MAVVKNPVKTTLQVKLKTGVDAKGNDIIKTISFAKVKVNATPAAIHAVASAMTTVLGGTVSGVYLADAAELINE